MNGGSELLNYLDSTLKFEPTARPEYATAMAKEKITIYEKPT